VPENAPLQEGQGHRTAWLNKTVLLAAGEFPLRAGTTSEVELGLMPGVDGEARFLHVAQDELRSRGKTSRGVVVARLRKRPEGLLEVVAPSRFTLAGWGEGDDGKNDLHALLQHQLARLDTAQRQAVRTFVLDSCAEKRFNRALSTSLHQMREALRDRLPTSAVDRDSSLCLQIDALYRIDSRSFYIEGWSRSERRLTGLAVISPEGWAVDLEDRVYRYRRPDVAEFLGETHSSLTNEYGFVAYFELPSGTTMPTGWVVQATAKDGSGVEAAVPPVTTDERLTRDSIVGDVALEALPGDALRRRHLLPALARIQRRLAEQTAIHDVVQFGTPPNRPLASIIVSLYKRVDFLEQQMSQFVLDPEMGQADLIYVLDSPEDAAYLLAFARQLYLLYRVPFRLATLTRNGGYSVANNLGASLARGRHLVLLNSDVLPEEPGWLSRLVSFYEATPRVGALSPKLLYEDDTLQFAGLYFDRPEGAHLWSNEHFYKGLHRDFPDANEARPVPAVTGACLLISTELFREVGGLRGGYVQGDYEDSDLCLRLAEAGYENWYYPDVSLYHLEGQSYPTDVRQATTEFNKWLHTHLWKEQLQELAPVEGRTPERANR
jgi:GT2 family glycosyltransferase